MEEGPSVPVEQPQDSEGEEEISELETDTVSKKTVSQKVKFHLSGKLLLN